MSCVVTAQMIKDLRDRTGVGMGKCKEALEEAKGDMDLAIANLRKSGMATAVKKEGRATNEGVIAFAESDKAIGIVEVNAETDFVVKNDRFQQFAKNLAEEVAETQPKDIESFLAQQYSKDTSLTIDQYRATIIQTIGENIQIRRLKAVPKSSDKSVGVYSHLGGKVLTVVEFAGAGGEESLAKDIAMHVAAAAPDFVSPDQVPASVIEQEKEIAKEQIKGKPAIMVDRIVEGKVNAYFDQVCLVCQKYIRDDSQTIADLVSRRSKETGKPLKLTSFVRWSVGQS